MGEVKFVLNEESQKIDPLGRDYIYNAHQHPEDETRMVVKLENNGTPPTANYEEAHYPKDVFEDNFEKGFWIKVD